MLLSPAAGLSVLAVGLSLLLSGPAQARPGDPGQPAATPSGDGPPGGAIHTVAGVRVRGDRTACTWARNVDDWQPVDRDHVIIRSGVRDRYLVRFSGACFGDPKYETAIGVVTRSSQLCGYGGDALIIDGQRCTVLEMWEVTQEQPEGSPAADLSRKGKDAAQTQGAQTQGAQTDGAGKDARPGGG
ncbi:hypothetical protein RC1_1591 [Rhodospirillum centenum SW]|uniref:Secreted protein n=2 Tax=Rhodospirillum centenum TaxID=34018 RepID=B6IN97_RHOCS|nr:hypothetical protein RC1_1591 [Rhodospirillum centenum SW]